jgi:hypothetical protein
MSGIFRIPISTLLLTALLLAKTVAAPLQNITIPLPPGSSDHGSPGLLCVPTKWTDIAVFFLANYAAHAVTTRSLPGERTGRYIVAVLGALFFPASGTFRGVLAILSFAKFGKSDLQVAARAGALCMVVRAPDWRPQEGDTLPNAFFAPERWNSEPEVPGEEPREQSENATPGMAISSVPGATDVAEAEKYVDIAVYDEEKSSKSSTRSLTPYARKIHGSFQLPPGYRLEFVPRRATFIDTTSEESLNSSGTTSISCNYSSVKILIALTQAVYSITTLYHTRGDQIRELGYAAFGLTVAPYALVSLLNLAGSLLCPEYPSLYLVESTIMQEASRRGPEYFFNGAVGRLNEDGEYLKQKLDTNTETPRWCSESTNVVLDTVGDLQLEFELPKDVSIPTREGGVCTPPSHSLPLYAAGRHKLKIWPREQGIEADKPLSRALVLIPVCNPTKQVTTHGHSHKILGTIQDKPGHLEELEDIIHDVIGAYALCAWINSIPLPIAIVGGLSHFAKGHSTTAERGWTMAWLICGYCLGLPFAMQYFLDQSKWHFADEDIWRASRSRYSVIKMATFILLFAAPAIGGFIVVGQMLNAYGTCISVS